MSECKNDVHYTVLKICTLCTNANNCVILQYNKFYYVT